MREFMLIWDRSETSRQNGIEYRFRGQPKRQSESDIPMANIYLIRHAQASFGTDHYDRLSALGRRQAEVLGQYLRDCEIHFDAVYSGDLERQLTTAKIASGSQPLEVPHQLDPRFNEVRLDEQLESLTPEVAKTHPEIHELARQGLKSSKEYQKAIEAVFNYWVSPQCTVADTDVMQRHGSGQTLGIFTSGGTIATIVSQVLGLEGEHAYKFFEPSINCSVTRLIYNDRKISLSYFNDHSYLDLLGQQLGERLVTYR
jgi:broad specificity phosphatase PhoE